MKEEYHGHKKDRRWDIVLQFLVEQDTFIVIIDYASQVELALMEF